MVLVDGATNMLLMQRARGASYRALAPLLFLVAAGLQSEHRAELSSSGGTVSLHSHEVQFLFRAWLPF